MRSSQVLRQSLIKLQCASHNQQRFKINRINSALIPSVGLGLPHLLWCTISDAYSRDWVNICGCCNGLLKSEQSVMLIQLEAIYSHRHLPPCHPTYCTATAAAHLQSADERCKRFRTASDPSLVVIPHLVLPLRCTRMTQDAEINAFIFHGLVRCGLSISHILCVCRFASIQLLLCATFSKALQEKVSRQMWQSAMKVIPDKWIMTYTKSVSQMSTEASAIGRLDITSVRSDEASQSPDWTDVSSSCSFPFVEVEFSVSLLWHLCLSSVQV